MKTNKIFTGIILTAMTTLFLLETSIAFCASSAVLSVGEKEAMPGDKDIVVPVSLVTQPPDEGVSIEFRLYYDNKKLDITKVNLGSNVSANKALTFAELGPPQTQKSHLYVLIEDNSLWEPIPNGEILNITFDILDTAVIGEEIGLTLEKKDALVLDNNDKVIPLEVNRGYIKIIGQENIKPVIKSLTINPPSATISETGTAELTVVAEDTDALTYTWKANTGTIMTRDGENITNIPGRSETTVIYKPAAIPEGVTENVVDTVTVTVSDGKEGGAAEASITITVTPKEEIEKKAKIKVGTGQGKRGKTGIKIPVNLEYPVPDGEAVTPLASTINFDISYDENALAVSNVEAVGKALSAGKTVASSTPSPGTLTLVVYSITEQQQAMEEGQIAEITFNILRNAETGIKDLVLGGDYAASDTSATQVALDITGGNGSIEVAPGGNTPPRPDPRTQDVTTSEDVPVDIVLTGADDDGDTLSYEIVTPPANGTVSLSTKDLFGVVFYIATYKPNLNYNGEDSFTFRVYDGIDYSELPGTVNITVTPVNDNPKLELGIDNLLQIMDENNILSFTVTASDPDIGDTVTITTSPLKRWMSFDGSVFRAEPGYEDSGNYEVTFTAKDIRNGQEAGGEDNKTVIIKVNNSNRPPVITKLETAPPREQPIIIKENETLTLKVTVEEKDIEDQDKLTYAWSVTGGGTIEGSGREVLYKPANITVDVTDTVTVIVRDGHEGGTAEASIAITVTPVTTEPIEGDINEDGVVDEKDVQACVNVILKETDEMVNAERIIELAKKVAPLFDRCDAVDLQKIINIFLSSAE